MTVATPLPPAATSPHPGPSPAAREGETSADPLVGKVLGGVKLVRKLGAGGMGAVYAGFHLVLETTIAVKVLPSHLTSDLAYSERFLREAQVSFTIAHENVVRTLNAGKEEGVFFLQMELIEGLSAGEMVRRSGPLPEARAVEIVRDAARGLAEAHRKGIIHRDVKPDNILVRADDGKAKVADLGLARISHGDATAAVITGAGTTLGTPAYMAPEQIEDASHVGASADIYSLGATLYELLCGRPPFQSASIPSLFQTILKKEAPDPRDLRSDISPAVREIVRRCLEKKPTDRYASAEELARALDDAFPKASKGAPPPITPRATSTALTESYHATSSAKTIPLSPRFRRRWFLIGGAIVLVALGLGFFLGAESPGPIEKKTLKYGILPDRRLTTERLKLLEPVTKLLEQATRRKWEPWVGERYEDNIDEFVSGKLDLAQFGGATYVVVKERAPGAHPLVQRDVDQKFQTMFVVGATSTVQRLEDLRGKEIAVVDKLSTAGYVIPCIELLDAGLDPLHDLKLKEVHTHDTVLREVQDGTVEAGTVDARIKELLSAQGKIDRDKIRSIKTSPPFLDDVYVASPGLDATLAEKVAQAFLELDMAHGTDAITLQALEATHYVRASDESYEDLRAKVKRLRERGLFPPATGP